MDSSSEDFREDHDDSHSDTFAMRERHDAFVKEAFVYLLDYFGIQAKTDGEFRFFTETTGRAIITLGYIFRRRLRTFLKNGQRNLGDINEFQKTAEHFEIIRDKCYFFRILRRISHIFELTIFCLKEGYNYIETACEIFTIDNDTVFFENNGGLDRLNETAFFISEVGEVFFTVIQEEKPQDTVLKSFVKAVEHLEKPFGDSVLHLHKGILSLMKDDVRSQMEDIHAIDPRLVKVFYHTLIQNSSKIFTINPKNTVDECTLDIESEKKELMHSFRCLLRIILGEWKHCYLAPSVTIKLAGCFTIFRHLTDLMSTELESEQPEHELWTQSPHSPQECYSLKEYFLVSFEYIRIRKSQPHSFIPGYQPVDAAIQPSIKKMYQAKLKRVLDANVKQNNYFTLNNGWCVVYTPDCKFDDTTTSVVVNGCFQD